MLDFSEAGWIARIALFVPLLLSLAVHEWAHAWTACKLGDDTAVRAGRLTLDPFAHVDPIGTLLLPLLGIPFGWAKPVPIEPLRFRRDVSLRAGIALAAAAGPLSNLCLAALCTALLYALASLAPGALVASAGLPDLLRTAVSLNLALALLNAVPIPPLDGSRVVDAMVPERLRPAWNAFAGLGPIALVALFALPAMLGAPPLARPLAHVERALAALLLHGGG
jgi:Zn-dependent protease